ncbi:hypothetical protein GBA52_022404 [Prunus armeniaca]|nr:hypothetical protein GBA52_022404 [Prunus armeniaca]
MRYLGKNLWSFIACRYLKISAFSPLLESFQASYPASTFPPLPERGDFDL